MQSNEREVDEQRDSMSMTRGEFIVYATLTSALVLGAPIASETSSSPEHASAGRPEFVKYLSLTPGEVDPQGWLQLYLQKQEDHSLSKLPNTPWPFTEAFWSDGEKIDGKAWWGWEQKGYWVDVAMRYALALGRQHRSDDESWE